MVEEEAFTCPFCGAPYRTLIPAGTVQVKCRYCGATVLVPPRLGGTVQRCPNHPDVLAVGLCNDCDKSYCDRCLYIYAVKDGKLHLCSKCYKNRTTKKFVEAAFVIFAFSIILLLISISGAGTPSARLPVLLMGFFWLALSILLYLGARGRVFKKKPLSVRDASMLKEILKKCVKCGREIPVVFEECPWCGTKQPEYVEL